MDILKTMIKETHYVMTNKRDKYAGGFFTSKLQLV